MIREASEIASVCDQLSSQDFEQVWNQIRSSNLATGKPGLDNMADIFLIAGYSEANEKLKLEWDALVGHCSALLKILERLPSKELADEASQRLAEVMFGCFVAGSKKRLQQSARIQSRKARAGKRRKASERARIIRLAILSVCNRERLTPVASEKFAGSIRPHVIQAANEIGTLSSYGGMSTRSIQRHIAKLLKDLRM